MRYIVGGNLLGFGFWMEGTKSQCLQSEMHNQTVSPILPALAANTASMVFFASAVGTKIG